MTGTRLSSSAGNNAGTGDSIAVSTLTIPGTARAFIIPTTFTALTTGILPPSGLITVGTWETDTGIAIKSILHLNITIMNALKSLGLGLIISALFGTR